jgi:hypothetical protein
MADAKLKLIEVTMTVQYFVPMIDDTRSKINGWTTDEIIEDWFKHHNINGYHCARDGSEIGGSKQILKIEVKDAE